MMKKLCPIKYGVKDTNADPYASNVVSLLHFNGSDGDIIAYYDEISSTGTMGANGLNSLKASPALYGSTVLRLLDIHLNTPIKTFSSFTWEVDSLFTMEGWYYFVDYFPSAESYLLSMDINGYAITLCEVEINATTKYLSLTGYGCGRINSTTAMPIGSWVHMAVTHDGATLRLFLGGVLIASGASVLPTGNPPLQVVAFYGNKRGGGGRQFFGNMDDCRITYDVARYTANFTPPSAEFPNP